MRAELTSPSVLAWRTSGAFETVHGLEVFVRTAGDFGAGATPIVVLHGFPTSSHDWSLVDPRFGEAPRLYFDFPGYGLSAKPERYSYSLFEQADVVEGLVHAHGLTRVRLVAHDMGTSVACELAARRLRGSLTFDLRSLVLMNGSVHLELAHLTPSQKLLRSPLGPVAARLTAAPLFKAQLRRILTRPVPEAELEAMWQLLVHREGHLRLPAIIGYLDERTRFAERWIGALRALDVPAGIIWGRRDPVAVAAIAEALAGEVPGAELTWLEDLGHYPQVEDPAAVAAALAAFHART